jgi:tetratricopeptide (TPR) repeat protein
MKLFTSSAIALFAGLIAAPAAAQYNTPTSGPQPTGPTQPSQAAPKADAKTPTLSNKAGKAIVELQKAVKAKDTASIPAKLAAAKAVAQTKDDHFAIGALQLEAAQNAKDPAGMLAGADEVAASGYAPPSTVSGIYTQLGVGAYNDKKYADAVSLFQKAATIDPSNAEAVKFLGLAQNASGNKEAASATLLKAIQQGAATGQKPPEDLYKQAVGVAYGSRSPTALELSRQWVAAYPTPDSWHDALAIYRNLGSPDSSLALDIMRLASATGSMRGSGDYNVYASDTINSMNYGEAKAVLAEGISSGRIKASDPVIQDLQNALRGKAAPTAAELSSREAGAKVPNAYMRVADAYYGAGNYQKAADLYGKAVAAGADANVGNLRQGEALARAGDKAGAAAAFKKVGGTQASVAKYWLLYTGG